jgi:hypothetical protein
MALSENAVSAFLSSIGEAYSHICEFMRNRVAKYADKNKDLAALIPLKSDSKLIGKYGMDNPVDILEGYTDGTVMYKKVKMKNGKWLYAFRDAKAAYEQEVGYVERAEKNKNFSAKDYEQKRTQTTEHTLQN